MCGILLAIKKQQDVDDQFELLWDRLKQVNAARGPDAQSSYTTTIKSGDGTNLEVRFFASELRLRGDQPIVQPHVESGDVLCWNGEVFEGLDVAPSENDGVKVFRCLNRLSDLEKDLNRFFKSIEGPYAFTYYHSSSNRLYFGRDPLGRRSLLLHRSMQQSALIISSVSIGPCPTYDVDEVSTEELHYIDLSKWMPDNVGGNIHSSLRCDITGQTHDFATLSKINTTIFASPPLLDSLSLIPEELLRPVEDLIYQLDRSVSLQVRDIPNHRDFQGARVAVLFSGGIDSTVLAFLADRHIPSEEPIDLLNVAFENPRKIQLKNDLEKKKNKGASEKQSDSKCGVRIKHIHGSGKEDIYLVPDRVTGLEELEELRTLCPGRQWNFVEINVTHEESTNARQLVQDLMFPSQTVMDLSLGLALYFASTGVGITKSKDGGPAQPYKSPARVLLNGLGSDELLGGYGRHRTAYSSGGWQAVIDELQLDIDRIPTRNLGRDDRIISSVGKEARHPFLSLSVVDFLVNLPAHVKMDPRLPLGTGDKMLLRLATRKLGLIIASNRKKRAMQFGSHSARMDGERRGDVILTL